jgi:hypothetical protein
MPADSYRISIDDTTNTKCPMQHMKVKCHQYNKAANYTRWNQLLGFTHYFLTVQKHNTIIVHILISLVKRYMPRLYGGIPASILKDCMLENKVQPDDNDQ